MAERDEETPPPGIESQPSDASVSTELPLVVLGEDVEASQEAPRVRLLQGRIHEAWVMYPVYGLVLGAGLLAVRFAATTAEWSAIVVGLAWFLLFVWNWFYGVAYRYRRPLLKYSSVLVVLALTAALAYFSMERAAAQRAMISMNEIAERPEAPTLYWAAVATMVAAALLVLHLVFLGRGYRRKQAAG